MLASLLVSSALGASAVSHPSLPTQWTATVNEAQVGVVKESYTMVSRPDADHPSAKWTNFTDGSCQRLIYIDGDLEDDARYLLNCDAVACCTEEQDGNHIEYQIPNTHPEVPVKSLGKQNITLYNGEVVETDVWEWRVLVAKYTAFTRKSTLPNATAVDLVRWTVGVSKDDFTNEYTDFQQIPAEKSDEFAKSFQIPEVCKSSHVMKCDNARKQGLLSDRSYSLLKYGASERLIWNVISTLVV